MVYEKHTWHTGEIITQENMNAIENELENISTEHESIAEDFVTNKFYAKGKFVWYNNELYCFKANHPAGTWSSADVDKVVLADKLKTTDDLTHLTTETLTNVMASLAEPFSPSKAYTEGEYCWYSSKLYRFTTNHSAGAWSTADTIEVELTDDISEIKNTLGTISSSTIEDIIEAASSAAASAEEAAGYAAEAFSGTPEGYEELVGDVGDLKSAIKDAIDELPFSEITEDVDLTWVLEDKYRVSDGTYIDKNWAYDSTVSVEPGEKYYVTGYSYYELCIYYVEDSNGDIIDEKHFSGTNTLHENMEVVIPDDGVALVLQVPNADARSTSSLKKYDGVALDDDTVGYSNLKSDVRSGMMPSSVIINLYNDQDTDIITGKYIGSDGSLTNSDRMQVSGYIPVEYGKTYAFPAYTNYFGESSPKYVNAYFADKTRYGAITGTVDTTKKITTFTVNASTIKYVRVNIAAVGSSAAISLHLNGECFMLTESPYPQNYHPYGGLRTFSENVYLSDEQENNLNSLFRKSVVFAGDSICNGASANDGKSGWAGRIGRKNEMLWINKGISGATLTAGLTGSYGVISETSFDDADFIIIEGGTNDADLIGNALETTPAGYGSYSIGDYTSTFENTTYCGAIEYLFKRLANDCKSAKCGVIIAPKMGQLNASVTDYTPQHNNRRKYFDTLIDLCEKWGVPYLNLWDGSIMNPMMPDQYTYQQASSEGKFYTDGQHLTSDGYDRITPIIEAWMKTL